MTQPPSTDNLYEPRCSSVATVTGQSRANPRARTDVIVLLALVLLILAALPLGATTFVMPTDEELYANASLVVVATIDGRSPTPGQQTPATDFQVHVERVLKGFVLATDLVVRVPGGLAENGLFYRIYGSPQLEVGDRAILFLNDRGGFYRIEEMQLGAFLESGVGSGRFAVRPIAASEIQLNADPLVAKRRQAHEPRDFERFSRWLADRSNGISREPDYFVVGASDLVGKREAFRNITFGCNAGDAIARWPQFDSSQRVTYFMNSSGQPNVPGGGFDQIRNGINAWNGVAASKVNLFYGGTTNSTIGGTDPPNIDRILRIILEDPNGIIDGSFPPSGGGTLAVTIVVADCGNTKTYVNGLYAPIVDADIIGQDGIGANFFTKVQNAALAFERIFTHELGHGIGLSHSCGDEGVSCTGSLAGAIMRADYNDSLLGSTLNSDDKQAARFTYPEATTGGGAPAAPSSLVATAISISEIGLTWADNSSNESGFEVEERILSSPAWSPLVTLPANTMSITVENIPTATARVYRVRATTGGAFSAYSNEAQATTFGLVGPCVETETTICLTADRFAVTTRFRTNLPSSGMGHQVSITPDTAYFWFFSANNVEVTVKVLDACVPILGNRFWVFAGGLTDVEVELTVVDTVTGDARTYFNPLGTPFQPVQDTGAFNTCLSSSPQPLGN